MKNMKNIPLATVLQRFSTIDVVKLSCLVQFNHVSSGVHFSGAAPIFLGKIDPAPSKNGSYAYDATAGKWIKIPH